MKGKNGFVDKMGHLKINLGDSTSTYFSEGMAPVVKGSKVGFINKRGTIVIQPTYGLGDSATHFQNGYAIVDEGFIDKAGRRLITDRDYTLFRDNDNFCNGLASVWANGNTGYIDVKGNTVIEGIGGRQFSEGLAAALKDGMFGYFDTNGDFVIEPQFGKAELFSEDLAFVVFKTNESKCGYIDRSRKLVIELKWRYGMEFTNGVALVYNTDTATNQWGYIDKRGNYVWKNFK